jgi:hypothetical protein
VARVFKTPAENVVESSRSGLGFVHESVTTEAWTDSSLVRSDRPACGGRDRRAEPALGHHRQITQTTRTPAAPGMGEKPHDVSEQEA